MIIACDVDNVLNNLTESVLKVYNSDYNDNLKIEDIKSYGIEDYVKPEFKNDFPSLFLDKRVWKGISVIPGCVEVLKKWYDNGQNERRCRESRHSAQKNSGGKHAYRRGKSRL